MAPAREAHVFRDSTRVDRAWYDPNAKVIEILFPDSVRFLYFEVEPATWKRFTQAESAGKFLHEVLERHPYRHR